MFKILTISASTLLFTALAKTAPVKAQNTNNSQLVSQAYNITPRQLISLARHGRFKAQGIPSHSNFGSSLRSGKITAELLVQSAIRNNRLPEVASSDRNYLKVVNDHLKSGGCGSV